MHRSFLAAALAMPTALGHAAALGTAFTYQGQLSDGGHIASGLYDLQFCLFDGPSNPVPIACAADQNDVPVENGLFTVALDFGNVFAGNERYLELRVRPGASGGGFTILSPRQTIAATPEAMHAGSVPWIGISGMPAGFADGVDNDSGGTVTSVGAGSGLSGGPITSSGTLSIATGGVSSAMIADGAVGAMKIDHGEVQAKIDSSDCPAGTHISAIGDTTRTCTADSGITSVSGGGGVTANLAGGVVTLGSDATIQRRVNAPGCSAGFVLRAIAQDGTPTCVEAAGSATQSGAVLAPSGATPALLASPGFKQVAAGQRVNITVTAVFGAGIAAGGLELYPCYQAYSDISTPSGPLTTVGDGLHNLSVAAGGRLPVTLGATVVGLSPGLYLFGLCGDSGNDANWTSNGNYYATLGWY